MITIEAYDPGRHFYCSECDVAFEVQQEPTVLCVGLPGHQDHWHTTCAEVVLIDSLE